MFFNYEDTYYIKKSVYKTNYFKSYERAILESCKEICEKCLQVTCLQLEYKK